MSTLAEPAFAISFQTLAVVLATMVSFADAYK